MRRITNIILLSAGVLLSLTGCQKGNEPQNSSDRAVRFGAGTVAETRTSFSGDRSDGERERVDPADGQMAFGGDAVSAKKQRGLLFFHFQILLSERSFSAKARRKDLSSSLPSPVAEEKGINSTDSPNISRSETREAFLSVLFGLSALVATTK